MKRKKLLKTLADLLDGEGRKKTKHHDDLEMLLAKLKEKEVKLEEKIAQEKDKRKQKRLSRELEIAKAQYAKGLETLQSLDES
jgi:predicted  nucleic acid-binding Zn-ribbon protein